MTEGHTTNGRKYLNEKHAKRLKEIKASEEAEKEVSVQMYCIILFPESPTHIIHILLMIKGKKEEGQPGQEKEKATRSKIFTSVICEKESEEVNSFSRQPVCCGWTTESPIRVRQQWRPR